MNTQQTQDQTTQAKALMTAILARSARDYEFRQQLLTDPRTAVAEHLGIASSELPESFALTFTEQPGTGGGVRLPDYAGVDVEMPEYELEAVSGGYGGAALLTALVVLMDYYDDHQCPA